MWVTLADSGKQLESLQASFHQHTEASVEFRDLLVVNWSQDGSNRREAEEETIFSWECLLNSIQGKC